MYCMPRENRKSLSILKDVYDKCHIRYVEETGDPDNDSVTRWTSDYLNNNLTKDETVRKNLPEIMEIAVKNKTLFLKDGKKNKLIEIKVEKGLLKSNDPDSKYIQFAMTSSNILRLYD